MDFDSVRYVSETRLTVHGRRRVTTVPKAVVKNMELKEGDRLRWIIFEDKTILLTRAKGLP